MFRMWLSLLSFLGIRSWGGWGAVVVVVLGCVDGVGIGGESGLHHWFLSQFGSV